MARSPFQKPPIPPVDLFEDFVEQHGDLRSRQTNVVFFQPQRSSRQKFPLIVTVITWLICAAFGISVAFVAWLIIGTLTMYRL
jgi:hypothetical protein